MDLILYTLKSVATAIVEPLHLLMLIILGVMFYIKNRRISVMQKMTIGERLDSPLELTLSQIVLGIVAGAIGSLILTILGVNFNENSGIEFIFMASILLLFYKPRFVCFAYSGAILGLISIVVINLSQIIGQQSYLDINILNLVTFVGVLHVIEGILVIFDGSRGAVPVFTNKKEKIIGGFSLNRYWALPIAVLMIFSGQVFEGSTVAMETPSWWPVLNKANTLAVLATSIIATIPFYGVLGYNAVTFTKEKKKKALESGTIILIYGVSVVVIGQIAVFGIIGQLLAIAYMPLAHELMLKYQKREEAKGQYLYVSDDDGISVLEVAPSSPAFEVGIRRGDKIIAINGEKIESEGDLFKVVRESVFKIPIRVKTTAGEIVEYMVQPRNKRLGMLLVPKMVKREDIVGVAGDDFKKLLEELKSKK